MSRAMEAESEECGDKLHRAPIGSMMNCAGSFLPKATMTTVSDVSVHQRCVGGDLPLREAGRHQLPEHQRPCGW